VVCGRPGRKSERVNQRKKGKNMGYERQLVAEGTSTCGKEKEKDHADNFV